MDRTQTKTLYDDLIARLKADAERFISERNKRDSELFDACSAYEDDTEAKREAIESKIDLAKKERSGLLEKQKSLLDRLSAAYAAGEDDAAELLEEELKSTNESISSLDIRLQALEKTVCHGSPSILREEIQAIVAKQEAFFKSRAEKAAFLAALDDFISKAGKIRYEVALLEDTGRVQGYEAQRCFDHLQESIGEKITLPSHASQPIRFLTSVVIGKPQRGLEEMADIIAKCKSYLS